MGLGETLALAASLCYGVTHFYSGLLSRRDGASGIAVATFAQAGGTLLAVTMVLLVPGGEPTPVAMAWGGLSGVGTGLGMAFLYRGLARGSMSVVAPVSDVTAVALPVLLAVAVLGERPSLLALIGIGAAFPAIWLVCRDRASPRPDLAAGSVRSGDGASAEVATAHRHRLARGAGDGVLGGLGVALTWVCLAQIPAGAGLWPFVLSRVVSVAAILPLAVATRTSLRAPRLVAVPAAAVGMVGTVASLLYMWATREDLLALVTVLSALYPAITVLLAVSVLRERLSTRQAFGLLCAGIAVSFIAFNGES